MALFSSSSFCGGVGEHHSTVEINGKRRSAILVDGRMNFVFFILIFVFVLRRESFIRSVHVHFPRHLLLLLRIRPSTVSIVH